MSKLELDLMEYVHTREAMVQAKIDKYGPIGAHIDVDEPAMIADLRAIMDGQPLPRGAE